MTNSDVDAIAKIEKETFPTPWSKDAFLSGLLQNYVKSFIIENEFEIVAYAVVWFAADELHFANLAVIEKYRRCGLASWLISELFIIAKSQNIKFAFLEVRRSNQKALALYEKFGFNIIGIRKKYYSEQNEDAILMSCSL